MFLSLQTSELKILQTMLANCISGRSLTQTFSYTTLQSRQSKNEGMRLAHPLISHFLWITLLYFFKAQID